MSINPIMDGFSTGIELILVEKTAAEWTAQNPKLKKFEIGRESDTGKEKKGNGETLWEDLSYEVAPTDLTGTYATGTYTFTSNPAEQDTLQYIKDDAAITFAAVVPDDGNVQIGPTIRDTVTDLVRYLNDDYFGGTEFSVSEDGQSMIWTSATLGASGNTVLYYGSSTAPVIVTGAAADAITTNGVDGIDQDIATVAASAASAVQTTRKVNGVALSENISVDIDLLLMQGLGSGIKAQSQNFMRMSSSGITLVDTLARFTAVYLPKESQINGAKWHQMINGDYTADAYNGIGLYSYVNGLLTLVASTVNDGDIWKAGIATQSKAFSAPVTLQPGVYFVAYLYNSSAQVWAPQVGGYAATATSNLDFTVSSKISGSVNSLASLPASLDISTMTYQASHVWAALY